MEAWSVVSVLLGDAAGIERASVFPGDLAWVAVDLGGVGLFIPKMSVADCTGLYKWLPLTLTAS